MIQVIQAEFEESLTCRSFTPGMFQQSGNIWES